jgi:hypothetical protein
MSPIERSEPLPAAPVGRNERRFAPSRAARLAVLLAVFAACSSSSAGKDVVANPEVDASSEAATKGHDAGVDPVKAFVTQSSYATFAYEACTGTGNPDAPYGSIDGGCSGEALAVVLTSNGKLTCAAAATSANYLDVSDTSTLLLTLSTATGVTSLATGTYTVGDTINAPIVAHANFGTNDAQCNVTQSLVQGGSVSVTTLTAGAASGSYDLTFTNGDTLKGSFSVEECSGATNPAILAEAFDAGSCRTL